MRNITLGMVGVIVVVAAVTLVYQYNFAGSIAPRACTEEAKICPDGSAVGRTGPNCEFAACPEVKSSLTEAEAKTIAEKTCIKGGQALGPGSYNPNSKTWWFDANLNATRPGCNPACVVSEDKTAEINWRCTGAIVPPLPSPAPEPEPAAGYIAGHVTIGPNCPVERVGQPCPTPPEAYTSRSVVVFGSDKVTEKQRVSLDTLGNYKVATPPGTYFVQIQPAGIGPGEKRQVVVTAQKTSTVDFNVDTGIR